MSISLSDIADEFLPFFETFLKESAQKFVSSRHPALAELQKSMSYSLLGGGKRFRPLLSYATSLALKVPFQKIVPFAAALEMIHAYSLIHDDLPIMDNDDFRRGEPTNHKVFGESTALLAGSTLLSEAFYLLATHYSDNPSGCVNAVELLANASGGRGMTGGQVLDLYAIKNKLDRAEIEFLHVMKTGALIHAAVMGPAVLFGANSESLPRLKKYAESIGLAFQIADDLLDFDPKEPEPNSYPFLLGLSESRERLKEVSGLAISNLSHFGSEADLLRTIVDFNLTRSS